MRIGVLWLGVFGLLLRAAAGAEDPIPEGRPPEWSFSEGFGFTVNVNRGRSHELALFAHPGVSFRLSSRFEWMGEGHFAHFFSPGGYMVGLMPIGGRIYIGKGPRWIYATFGMGAGWTNLAELDEIDQRFNFILQTGVGLRSPISETQAWTVEMRWSHISNAGMNTPNLGLNMLVFLGGFRFR
jgi:hypothetical protein